MTTVAVIDTNQKIVSIVNQMQSEMDKGGAASPYFEELWYSLTVCIEDIGVTLEDHEARLVAGGL